MRIYGLIISLFLTCNVFAQIQGTGPNNKGNVPLHNLRHASGPDFIIRSAQNGQAQWIKDTIYFPKVFTVASTPITAKKGDFWRSTANGNTYLWDGTTWQLIAKMDGDTSSINELIQSVSYAGGFLNIEDNGGTYTVDLRDTLFGTIDTTGLVALIRNVAPLTDSIAWANVKNKPLTFTPSTHTHTIGNVTGLQDSLNVKSPTNHTHTIANVTGLQDSLNSKKIQSVANYTALRALNNYVHDVIVVNDWTYTGPDGNTYTTKGGIFKKVSSGTENGGTIIVGNYIWSRDWDGINVKPEWWECGGYDRNGVIYTNKKLASTGIYSEADRLDNAARLVIAGIGSKVVLEKRLYLIDRQIGFVSTDGNGATLRTNRPETTTNTVAYTSGQNQITVANAANYRVGQYVLLTNSATTNSGIAYSENISNTTTKDYLITNITGNVITIGDVGVQSVGIGNIFAMIPTLGSVDYNARIENVNFDGQYNTNTNTVDWRYTGFLGNGASIATKAGENATHFQGCRFDNIIGTAFNGASFRIIKCYASNIGGGVFHYGGGFFDANGINQFATVDGLEANNVVQVNPLLSNHQEALFTFSTNTKNIHLTNINVRELKGAIFGYATNDDYTFELTNSTFEGVVPSWANSTYPFLMGRFTISGSDTVSNENQQRVLRITNCSFNTCGDLLFYSYSLEKNPFSNIYINGNKFNNMRINAHGCTNVNINSNTFTNVPFSNFTAYTYMNNNSANTFNTAQIAVNWSDRVNITNNFIEGLEVYNQYCDYGIQTQLKKVFRKDGTGANTKIYYCSNIKIKNNTVSRYSFGIGHLQRLEDQLSGWNAGHSTWGNGTHIGNEISGNVISFHKNTQYDPTIRIIWGIMALQGTIIENNTIYHPFNNPTNAIRHIVLWGINTDERANLFGGIVRNNMIYSPSGFINIIVGTGAGGDNMEDNVIVTTNYTAGTIYSTKGHVTNNFRTFSNGFPHMTTPYMNPDLNGFLQNKTQY